VSGGFARNLLADFPSYCPEIPCNTTAFEAGFCPRTKECRTKINCDRQYACGISGQSAEKSDNAPYAQALCGVAQGTIPAPAVGEVYAAKIMEA